MNYAQLHPCAECPFRKASLRGWLGEDRDPEELINSVLGLNPIGKNMFAGCEPMDFDCHVSTAKVLRDNEIEEGEVPLAFQSSVNHCVGAMLMLKARCKRPHNIVKSTMMDKDSATEPMILNREEFIAHHSPFKTTKTKAKKRI